MANPKRVWHKKQLVWKDKQNVWLEGDTLQTYWQKWWDEITEWDVLKTYDWEWEALAWTDTLEVYDSSEGVEIWTVEDGVQASYQFVDWDWTVISEWKVKDGETPPTPQDPHREADAQYTYTFTGWSPAVWPIDKNMVYHAQYSSTLRTYNVTYVVNNSNYGHLNGWWQDTQQYTVSGVPYGSSFTVAGNVITVNNDTVTAVASSQTTTTTYQFANWLDSSSNPIDENTVVQWDMVITCNFIATDRLYTVTLSVDPVEWGTMSESSVSVPYNSAISVSDNTLTIWNNVITATPATSQDYTYTFSKFQYKDRFARTDTIPSTVTKDSEIRAVFTRSLQLTIVPNNAEYGSVSTASFTSTQSSINVGVDRQNSHKLWWKTTSSFSVQELSVATPASDTAEYTYSLENFTMDWNVVPTFNAYYWWGIQVSTNKTITANFTRSTRLYTVDASGTWGYADSVSVPYWTTTSVSGNIITFSNWSTMEAIAYAGYVFDSFSNVPATVTDDATITLNFIEVGAYNVTTAISGEGTLSETELYDLPWGTTTSVSGNTITFSTGDTIVATPATWWTFSSFSNVPATLTEDVTITANFTASWWNSGVVTLYEDPAGFSRIEHDIDHWEIRFIDVYDPSNPYMVVISDRNIWATKYYWQSWTTSDSYGNFYKRWADTPWDATAKADDWENGDYSIAPNGYYIPYDQDYFDLANFIAGITWSDEEPQTLIARYCLFPKAGYCNYGDGITIQIGEWEYWRWWCVDNDWDTQAYVYDTLNLISEDSVEHWNTVRCFRDADVLALDVSTAQWVTTITDWIRWVQINTTTHDMRFNADLYEWTDDTVSDYTIVTDNWWLTDGRYTYSISNDQEAQDWESLWQDVESKWVLSTAWITYDAVAGEITIQNGQWSYTMQDKNLGATNVYTTWDTLSEANCGKLYQWGNNYGFAFTWATTVTQDEIDTTWYWPWNYYNSNGVFNYPWEDWSVPSNPNLWGWVTWTDAARQWPAPSGYHVPSIKELYNAIKLYWMINPSSTPADLLDDFKFAPAWSLDDTGNPNWQWDMSTLISSDGMWVRAFSIYCYQNQWNESVEPQTVSKAIWCSIRCFKNAPSI